MNAIRKLDTPRNRGKASRFVKTFVLGALKTLLIMFIVFVIVDYLRLMPAWVGTGLASAVVFVVAFIVQEVWIYKIK